MSKAIEPSLKKEVPRVYLRTKDTEKYIEIIEEGNNQMIADTSGICDAHDIDFVEERIIDIMILDEGWTVDAPFTLLEKRKIVRSAKLIYNKKGTDQGIIFAIKEILGIDVTITDKTGTTVDQFILNASILDGGDLLGDSGAEFDFIVNSPILTADELLKVIAITAFVKFGPTSFVVSQT